jgi:hypothetical protein
MSTEIAPNADIMARMQEAADKAAHGIRDPKQCVKPAIAWTASAKPSAAVMES